MKKSAEYESFDRTMRELMKVPHAEIKAKRGCRKKQPKRESGRLGSLPLWTAFPAVGIRKASEVHPCQ